MRAAIRDNGNLLYNVVDGATRVTILLLLFLEERHVGHLSGVAFRRSFSLTVITVYLIVPL